MAGVKIGELTPLGRNLIATDELELSLVGSTGSRKITGQQIINAIPSGITIGTTAITSGTVGRVLFEGTGNVVQESANLFWDNTNIRLGVGIATPTNTLNVYTSVANYGLRLQSNATGANLIGTEYLWDATQLGTFSVNGSSGEFKWFMKSGGFFPTIYSNGVERLRIATTGNVLIGTTTDAGYKLDVNGTARVQDRFQIGTGTTFVAGFVFNPSGSQQLEFWNGVAIQIRFTREANNSLSFGTNGNSYAGNLSTAGLIVGGANANSKIDSAMLQVESTTRGFLPPRMTTTQKNAIASPATGLMVYDTTLNLISVYNGTTWITL